MNKKPSILYPFSKSYLLSLPSIETIRLFEQIYLDRKSDLDILSFFYNKDLNKYVENKENKEKDVKNEKEEFRKTMFITKEKSVQSQNSELKTRETYMNIKRPNLIIENPFIAKDKPESVTKITPFSDSNHNNIIDPFSKENKSIYYNDYKYVGPIENIKSKVYNKSKSKDFIYTQLVSYNISYWRKISGDGNCFYRSVLFSYLENIILHILSSKSKSITPFLNIIIDICFTSFPEEHEKNKDLLLTCLIKLMSFLKASLESKEYSFLPVDFLYRIFNLSDLIEKSFILWLRLKIASFLIVNSHIEINGLKIINSLVGYDFDLKSEEYDQKYIEKYINENVIKMEEYAEGTILYVTAIVLKVNICIYSSNQEKKLVSKVDFINTINNIHGKIIKDDLNLYDFTQTDLIITLFFEHPHYDLLYSSDFSNILTRFVGKMFEYMYLKCSELDEKEYNENCDFIRNRGKVIGLSCESKDLKGGEIKEENQVKSLEKRGSVRKDSFPCGKDDNKADGKKESKNDLEEFCLLEKKVEKEEKVESQVKVDVEVEVENHSLNSKNQLELINKEEEKEKETYTICTICLQEKTSIIILECSHSFCFDCFETRFILIFFKKQKNIDEKRLFESYSIEEIRNILIQSNQHSQNKNQYQCLNPEICFNRLSLNTYLLAYKKYTETRSNLEFSKEKRLGIYIKEIKYKLKTFKEKRFSTENNKKYCKECNSLANYLKLSCGCRVCLNCQSRIKDKSLFGVVNDGSILCILKCISCRKSLDLLDYFFIFNEKFLVDVLSQIEM